METKIDKKMKSVASIPANYVSILQLQERWLKEKERKQRENDSVHRGVKQHQQQEVDDEQRKREQGNQKTEPKVNLEENRFRRNCDVNRWKNKPNCGEEEEGEVSAIVNKKEENGGKKKKRYKKKREVSPTQKEDNPVKEEIQRVCTTKEDNADRDSVAVETRFQNLWIEKRVEEEEGREAKIVSKKGGKMKKQFKNQGVSMEEAVKRESKVSPEYIQKEDNPVKEEIRRVCTPNADRDSVAVETQDLWMKKRVEEGRNAKIVSKKGSKTKKQSKNQDVSMEDNPVKEEIQRVCTPTNEDSVAIETQFQDLWIKKRVEEGRDIKGPSRLNYGRNQRHDWSSTRVSRATNTMVWVKKENNGEAGGGYGV